MTDSARRAGSGALLAAALVAGAPACAPRARVPRRPASAAGSAPAARAPLRAVGPRVVYSAKGLFDTVLVVDDGDIRYLRFGNVEGDDQSEISLSDPDAVPMEYIRYATIGLAYADGRGRTLMIGLGGGTFTTMLRRLFPAMWIEVAEIDPVVADVAKRFFGLREDDRYHVHIGDGRAYVERSTEQYDLVLLDAFSGAGIPAHLGRRDFFELVRARLADGGAAVANIAAADDAVERGLVDAFREAFPLHACFETPESGNIVLVGVVGRPLPDAAALRERARTLGAALHLPFDLVEVAARLGTGCI